MTVQLGSGMYGRPLIKIVPVEDDKGMVVVSVM